MHSIQAFVERQNRMLAADFADTLSCFVALPAEEFKWRVEFEQWTVCSLPGCKTSSAIVVRKSPTREPECWARWNYRDYRRAFSIFLRQYYPQYSITLDSSVQVDHLEPRFRF